MLKFAIILAAVAVCHVQATNNYRLYTTANPLIPVNMTTSDSNLPDEFKSENNTIILIHGHGGRTTDAFNTLITADILRFQEHHNVIVVDWENEASHSYSVAVSYVPHVANDLREFLRWLTAFVTSDDNAEDTTTTTEVITRTTPVVDFSKLHLVGFGLGAHVAGIASRQLRFSHGLVGRITGLDPSGSRWGSDSERLRDTDAVYVEVIHTDGSGLLANGIGTRIGHRDFYANGGNSQPGCYSHTCCHNRAYELFAASMRGHLFGNGCNTMLQMNLNLCRGTRLNMGGTELSKSGYETIYRINTNRRYPF